MIKCRLSEPADPAWEAWREEGRKTTEALVCGGPPYKIDEKLYKKMRAELFASYHNKCVYCEGDFRLSEVGDVEHFRPKSGVRNLKNEVVYVSVAGVKEKHLGYYWLAYEPTNLFPSCTLCNRMSRGGGKGERFPVIDDSWATRPGDEKDEKPLLLHPLDDDPAEHLVFDPETGLLGCRTPRGEACIEIFGLNTRQTLIKARRNAYRHLLITLDSVMARFRTGGPELEESLREIASYRVGEAAYSMAGRKALDDCREPIEKLFNALLPLVRPTAIPPPSSRLPPSRP